eukprot:SAG25_NODE_6736_length_534_cov_0.657471_1_plen_134_part_10
MIHNQLHTHVRTREHSVRFKRLFASGTAALLLPRPSQTYLDADKCNRTRAPLAHSETARDRLVHRHEHQLLHFVQETLRLRAHLYSILGLVLPACPAADVAAVGPACANGQFCPPPCVDCPFPVVHVLPETHPE